MSVPNREGVGGKAGKSVKEEILEVPSALLQFKTGFSFDIGGSCIKLVYSMGEKGETEDSIVIRMTTFATGQLEEAMMFLKERFGGDVGRGQSVFTTGVGCHIHSNFINSALNIRLENVSEMDSFVKAFRFLVSNFPLDRITHGQSSVVTEYRDMFLDQIQKMIVAQLSMADGLGSVNGQIGAENMDFSKVHGDNENGKVSAEKNGSGDLLSSENEAKKASTPTAAAKETDVTKSEVSKDPYPCILAMMGSGGAIIKVEKDKFMVLDGMTRCGRMFLGLGALLTGCKTFDELIDLASRGNEENVMVLAKQLKTGKGSDVYSIMPDDLILYCFGRGVDSNLDEFKKEDLAAALLSTIGQDLAQTTHLNSHVLQTNTIYFCGSFVGQSQLVRDTIGRYFTVRSSFDTLNKDQPKIHHFLRFGGYFGALGCLIDNMNNISQLNNSSSCVSTL